MDQYIGKLLDNRYELLEVIGTGGMAVVYKARCHRLNRLVAVKVLKRDLASDAEFRRRFHDESQAVAMLSHPNIVAMYDVSRSNDIDYLVMELIDGITLKQYMQKKGGPLNWREALHFIIQIMKALSHAHSRGIIHRDIKPQNIMVLRDGSVKVADFGIARLTSAAQSTLTQEALGSVHYISPVQAKGSRIDARSDVYSAGVVLYEMLTGRLPFEGESPVSVAIQHISSIPLSPREINPEIPEALEAITLKAMASNVDHRYTSADAMLTDLEEFRKNPNINFDYSSADLFSAGEMDEPTQVRTVSNVSNRWGKGTDSKRRSTGEEKNGHYDENGSGSRFSLPIAIGAIAIFIIGIVYFLWVSFFSGIIQSVPEHQVPNLLGSTMEEVLSNKDITEVFTVEKGGEAYSGDYAAGQIISQDPESGKTVKGNNITITVTVSKGPEYISMPDVTNQPYTQAKLTLESLGLKVGDTPEYEASEDITKNYVISSDPAVGAQLSQGDEVTLVVSLGPVVNKVTVLSFVDQTIDEARETLKTLNLTEGSVIPIESDKPAGTIIYQSIPAGSEVDEGTPISFQVSKGSGEDASPSPDTSATPTPDTTVHTKKITVNLPENVESVRVRVEVDGVVKFNNVVYPGSMGNVIYPPVDGSGVQTVSIYFDDVLQDSYDLDFSK